MEGKGGRSGIYAGGLYSGFKLGYIFRGRLFGTDVIYGGCIIEILRYFNVIFLCNIRNVVIFVS